MPTQQLSQLGEQPGVVETGDFEPRLQQDVARLKIETRLKQLNDYSMSRDTKWREQFFARYSDRFDFFSFLDKQLAFQNSKHPIPSRILGAEKDGEEYCFSGKF